MLSYTVTNVSNPALFSALPAVAVSGSLTYTPAANAFGASTFMWSSKTAAVHNGGDDTSDPQTFTITVTPVNDAPVATAKSHQTHSGIRITIGAGDTGKLKDGATDVDDPPGDLVVSPTFSNETPAGATLTLTSAATGTFTFNPPAGYSGPASFTFVVCDDGTPTPPAMCSAPTLVSFNVTGPDLWFVDAGAPAAAREGSPIPSIRSPTSPRSAAPAIGSSSSPAPTPRGLPCSRMSISSAKDRSGCLRYRARRADARQRYARYQTLARRHPTTVERDGHARWKQRRARSQHRLDARRRASPAARSRV